MKSKKWKRRRTNKILRHLYKEILKFLQKNNYPTEIEIDGAICHVTYEGTKLGGLHGTAQGK